MRERLAGGVGNNSDYQSIVRISACLLVAGQGHSELIVAVDNQRRTAAPATQVLPNQNMPQSPINSALDEKGLVAEL